MIYTREDLKIMQNWSLEKKIQVTQFKIMEWYHHYGGRIFISYSGGKDSSVLLDLARRIDPEIKAVFADTGLEYDSIREHVKNTPNVDWIKPEMPFHQVIQQFGYPVISKEVSHRIYYARRGSEWAIKDLKGLNKDGTTSKYKARYMKYAPLVDAPFLISSKCCDILKIKPFEKYIRETGLKPIKGTMACESYRRRTAYMQTGCNAFHSRSPSSQPMSFWLEQDVLTYLKRFKIPYADIYGDIVFSQSDKKADCGKLITTGAKRTGCMFCMLGVHLEKTPNRFQKMKDTHPKQYDYCINKLGCGAVLDYLNVPYE
jgi:3'-phosphoadenosine 5'-phosphosulfate sulfotransferase (PAPS reductase)/FAD synthetase